MSDCIDKKIPKLISEGYPQDQAVAIAASMCEAQDRGGSYVTLSEDGSVWVLYGTLKLTADTFAEIKPQWESEMEDDRRAAQRRTGGQPYMEQRGDAWYLATPEQSDIAVGNPLEIVALYEKAMAIWEATGFLDGTSNIEDQYDDFVADDTARAVPEKYSHIDFKPTEAMANEAERGLAWREEHGRGGTEVGVARARDIKNRANLSPETVRRMKAYFDRHESDKSGEGFSPGEDGYPSAGRIAWALWGGDSGYSWARQRVESMNAADDNTRTETSDMIDSASTTRSTTSTAFPSVYRTYHRSVIDVDTVQGRIKGHIYIWGSPEQLDAYNTWFDPERPPYLAIENGMHRRPIMYEHSDDGALRREVIGTITDVYFDDEGLAFEGDLNRASPYFDRMVKEIANGELATSSATMPHTGTWREDGSFETWILGELSLTKNPAEFRMPRVSIVRSDAEAVQDEPRAEDNSQNAIAEAATPPPQDLSNDAIEPPDNGQRSSAMDWKQALMEALAAGAPITEVMSTLMQGGITPEQIAAYLNEMQPAPAPAAEPVVESSAPVQTPAPQRSAADALATLRSAVATHTQQNTLSVMQQQIKDLQAALNNREGAPPVTPTQRSAPVGANVNLIDSRKFAHYSPRQMWAAHAILRKAGVKPSDAFSRSMAHKTFDSLKSIREQDEYMANYAAGFTRADDFNASDIAGQGDEWVGVFYGSTIWQKARVRTMYAEMLRRGMMEMEVQQGAESAVVPLEGADPTFYTTAQANDKDVAQQPEVVVNYTFVGSESVSVQPGEVTGAVAYTDILNEDAVFDVVAQITTQLETKAAEIIESIIFNADTATAASTNINLIDGTPGSGLNKPHWLVTNGILKLALVTNTAMASDGQGALDLDSYLSLKNILPDELKVDPAKLMFVTDVSTYQASKRMPEILTSDVAEEYTLRTGLMPKIDGTDVFASGQIAKANNAGKIPVAGGTLGRILLIYPEYWALVWKRLITFETGRFMLSKTNVIAASMRIAVRYRSTTAAAVKYNVATSVSA